MFRFLAIETEAPLRLVNPLAPQFAERGKYIPAEGLQEAIDASMLLGYPLLLTGEPGTGKTSAAEWLADRLGARLLRYDVKSISTGRDLLYTFDEVARFRDGSRGESKPLIDYVQFNALGEAIIRAAGGSAPLASIKPAAETALRAFGVEDAGMMVARSLLTGDREFAAAQPEHCVVLIDEMDKAPRDTPNDLLAEIAQMAFGIPELGLSIGRIDYARKNPPPAPRPIVLITSNSEKGLPEPFLRRCTYFDIPLPGPGVLAAIVASTFPDVDFSSELFNRAHAFYLKVRNADWIRKKPGTAELLAWIGYIHARANAAKFDREAAFESLGCLLKTREDLAEGRKLFGPKS